MATELWLSRLCLNPCNRKVQRELNNSQALHRRILDGFPGVHQRADIELLYRIDRLEQDRSAFVAIIQSARRPQWSLLEAGYLVDEPGMAAGPQFREIGHVLDAVQTDRQFRFRLRANPSRKVHIREGDRPTGPNGTRKPLVDDADLTAWLERKGQQHGFQLLHERHQPDPITGDRQIGHKPNNQQMVHHAVLYDGVLQVADAASFRAALRQGIGPAKAYGFGLLSLARV